MDYAKLTYHDRNSADFGAKVKWGDSLASPARSITETTVPGQAPFLSDNLTWDNLDQTINFIVNRPSQYDDWHEWMQDFVAWLRPNRVNGHTVYEPFFFDLETDYFWLGYITSQITFTPATDIYAEYHGTATVVIHRQPWLYRQDGKDFEAVPLNVPITNWEPDEAYPIFHIQGSGDFVLTVNNVQYKINNVDDEIYLDCEKNKAFKTLKDSRDTHIDFPNHDFPCLKSGDNVIKLSGNATLFEYKPRWRKVG
ncbi:MAG: hypothetical protein LKF01_00150 [Lactobacillus sp.]|nr:hypothetical protein [Lactobacillus sp.]MCH4067954.1 hypothetical protein [Lactobacillus sp.]MCI1303607.1 hypothetical protein [Lactobacillus sp.]MCI1329884.1 hypothetical protein [Lactobacillus sp.]MCI1399484.1 hypothetical protein [Lactobacillus sp.]